MPSGLTVDVILSSNFKDLCRFSFAKADTLKATPEPNVVAHAFNPSVQEAEAGRLLSSGHPGLLGEILSHSMPPSHKINLCQTSPGHNMRGDQTMFISTIQMFNLDQEVDSTCAMLYFF